MMKHVFEIKLRRIFKLSCFTSVLTFGTTCFIVAYGSLNTVSSLKMPRLFDLPFAHIADMHFVYGFCNGNARAAVVEYRRRYPGRIVLGYRSFMLVDRCLREFGLVQRRNEQGTILDAELEEQILNIITRDPTTSIRQISIRLGIPKTAVWRVLKKEGLHPYHYRRSYNLVAGDNVARSIFCMWFLREQRRCREFLNHILWTDEATFTRAGFTNHRNAHIWAVENPHVMWPTTFQHQFSINVWAGIIDDLIIGPYILPNRLNQEIFLNFLQEIFPTLLEDVPLATRLNMWLQLDGAPAHFARPVRQFLNTHYPQWIGRGGTIAWPPRSPDLTPLDFYFWGYMKQKVYSVVIESREQLLQRINVAAEEVRQNRAQILRTTQSVLFRAQACLQSGGEYFEHLIN